MGSNTYTDYTAAAWFSLSEMTYKLSSLPTFELIFFPSLTVKVKSRKRSALAEVMHKRLAPTQKQAILGFLVSLEIKSHGQKRNQKTS